MRKFMFTLAALALMGVVAWAIQYGVRSDSGTGTHQGAISGDGNPTPFTFDANARLWVNAGVTATHDAAASASGTQMMLAYDSTLPTAVSADGDAAKGLGDEFGRARTGWEGDKWQGSVQSANASVTEAVIKAGTASKKIAVLWIKVHCDVALTVTLENEDDGVLDVAYCAAKGGYVITFPPESPLLVSTANKALQVQTSGAGNVSASAGGYLYP